MPSITTHPRRYKQCHHGVWNLYYYRNSLRSIAVITLQTLCWKTGAESRSWNKKYWRATNVLDAVVAIVDPSVCQTVTLLIDARNGLMYGNTVCTSQWRLRIVVVLCVTLWNPGLNSVVGGRFCTKHELNSGWLWIHCWYHEVPLLGSDYGTTKS